MAVVLNVQDLRWQRAGSNMAFGIDRLRLEAGDCVGLEGPPGAGKSTLLSLLALLHKPDALYRMELLTHEITPLWRDGRELACRQLRARHVGVLPQHDDLIASHSVRANLQLAQRLLGWRDDAHVQALLEFLELGPVQHQLPHALSPLQRRRAAAARALAHRPALLLADEPAGDDASPDEAQTLLDRLLALAGSSGTAVVVAGRRLQALRQRRVPVRGVASGAIGADIA